MPKARKSSKPGALAKLDVDKVIERVAQGEYAAHIATELGVSKVALHMKLKHHPKYKEAKEIGTEIRLDDGLAKLEAAGDDINLARAREIALRRLEWRAEREHAGKWGQKQEVKLDVNVNLADRLIRARERVINNDAAQLPQRSGDIRDAEVVEPGAKS